MSPDAWADAVGQIKAAHTRRGQIDAGRGSPDGIFFVLIDGTKVRTHHIHPSGQCRRCGMDGLMRTGRGRHARLAFAALLSLCSFSSGVPSPGVNVEVTMERDSFSLKTHVLFRTHEKKNWRVRGASPTVWRCSTHPSLSSTALSAGPSP